jgi:hypothetical protein
VPEAAPPAPPPVRPAPSSPGLPLAANGDKTIAMPPPSFGEPAAAASGSAVPAAKVPGTIPRPTLIGVPPPGAAPRLTPTAPPPVPPGVGGPKLPAPPAAARPVPAPPVKKDQG